MLQRSRLSAFYVLTTLLLLAGCTTARPCPEGQSECSTATTDLGAVDIGMTDLSATDMGATDSGASEMGLLDSGTPQTLFVDFIGAGSGSVTFDPDQGACSGDCMLDFDQGETVTIIASAGAGARFAGWGGACSGTADCTVTVNGTTSVIARFILTQTLTVTTGGEREGVVTVTSTEGATRTCDGRSSPCAFEFDAGAALTLTAEPAGDGVLEQWTGACSGSADCEVTLASDLTVGATFGLPPCPSLSTRIPVTENVTSNTVWDCPAYELRDVIFIEPGVTLTIAEGTTVYGAPDSALVASREGQLEAIGTPEAPIVFTSANTEHGRAAEDWRGLVLLGNAPINSGESVDTTLLTVGVSEPESLLRYGGTNGSAYCGTLSYVRVEYAGYSVSEFDNLSGLTVAGCGTDTQLSYIQVHRVGYDGVRVIGGTVALDHIVVTGAGDDSLDFDDGWVGQAQFLILHQFPGRGDLGIRGDNNFGEPMATPRTSPTLCNVTMIGSQLGAAVKLERGAFGVLSHFIVTGSIGGPLNFATNESPPGAPWENGDLSFNNSLFSTEQGALDESEMSRCLITRDDNGAPLDCTEDAMLCSAADDECLEGDDFGFDEGVVLGEPARNNAFEFDPGFGNISEIAPNYIPGSANINGGPAPPCADHSANYGGAIAPGAATSWLAPWTGYSFR